MKLISKKACLQILICVSTIFIFTSCHHHRENEGNYHNKYQQSLNNPDNFTVVKGGAVGTTYGWDVLLIKVVGLNYGDAIENLWANSGIPKNERAGCSLVNIRNYRGTEWGVIIIGQTYLTVIGDIVKLKK